MADTLTLTDAPAYLGQVSTDGDAWATDERPGAFRRKIMELYPNGDTPLTAITSMLPHERVTDPKYSWFDKELPIQGGAVSSVYDEETLTTEYTAGGVVGTIVFAKVALAVAQHFREGHQVALLSGYEPLKTITGKVVVRVDNGANSVLGVQLLEADGSNYLASSNYIEILGNINPEGGFIPQVIGYKPTEHYNYTQIFRDPYQITRTARQTTLRTRDPWKSIRQEALLLHGLGIERAFTKGERSQNLDGDEPERTTRGILKWIQNDAPQNMVSFYASTETDFVGQSWDDAGNDFIDRYLEHLFLYGAKEKVCLCGTGFLRGMNKAAGVKGTITIAAGQTRMGLKVTHWDTPYGSVWFKVNPLYARNDVDRWSGLFIDPGHMRVRFVQDTILKNDNGETVAGLDGYDGRKEEYLSEIGLELHHPKAFAHWSGIGLNHEDYEA